MSDPHDFKELKRLLGDYPNQVDGVSAAVCEVGEEYIEFFESQLARPGDENVIEEMVAKKFWGAVSAYLNKRSGRIYWRIRLDSEIGPWWVISRYDENGPDRDPITDRKCVMDHNWRRVAAYCRVYRASLEVTQPHPLATPARAA